MYLLIQECLTALISPLSLNEDVCIRHDTKSFLVVVYHYQETSAYFLIGLGRYSEIGDITDKVFTLYYDHLGFIHKLTPDHFEAGGPPAAFGNSRSIFGQAPDMGFGTALAPQFISLNEMIFFAYVPESEPQETLYTKKFNNMHYGKVINSGKTGKAYIRKVLQHDTPKGFLSSAIAEMIEPFAIEEANESSCLSSSLSVSYAGNSFYKLTLDLQIANALFEDTDIEKTVVIPGHSSFLITSIVDNKNALAIATMPNRVSSNVTFLQDSWFLYNFGQRNGRTWTIYSKPCNCWFQHNELLSISVVKYIDLGNSEVLKVKIIPNAKGLQILEVPLLKVLVGNPTLLEVKAYGTFDDTDSYLMKISVASKALRQGSTSLAFIVWGASTECFVTTIVSTLKSSCSYLRSMYHIPSTFIPLEDWISGVHRDSQGFNLIKTLPINYRPPSNMGVAIPLTDNFYHADPSKPIPRNLFYKSKKAGKFKQCANVSAREECNCTNDQKFSHAVAFSDYIEIISCYDRTKYDTELERSGFKYNVQKLRDYLEPVLRASVYNPLGLNLSIKGSELFHFRVTVIPGVTFCNLVEEFQIYVDEVPLPFPGHTLIAVATAVVLGGLIFTTFMFHMRGIYPWKAFQKWLRGNKVDSSNISINEIIDS
uniref:Cation channel sperm-associated protein subunit beta n=1 Tax=Prolemur simus TaxID=1328070 RepID=A0A8C8ZP01_PROSS